MLLRPPYIDWLVPRFWAGRKMSDGQRAELRIGGGGGIIKVASRHHQIIRLSLRIRILSPLNKSGLLVHYVRRDYDDSPFRRRRHHHHHRRRGRTNPFNGLTHPATRRNLADGRTDGRTGSRVLFMRTDYVTGSRLSVISPSFSKVSF